MGSGMRVRRTALTALVATGLPRATLACPVCFGQSDSPLAQGANSGIYFLLAVTAGVLVAFASFFIYLVRRARRFPVEANDRAPAQEGTV